MGLHSFSRAFLITGQYRTLEYSPWWVEAFEKNWENSFIWKALRCFGTSLIFSQYSWYVQLPLAQCLILPLLIIRASKGSLFVHSCDLIRSVGTSYRLSDGQYDVFHGLYPKLTKISFQMPHSTRKCSEIWEKFTEQCPICWLVSLRRLESLDELYTDGVMVGLNWDGLITPKLPLQYHGYRICRCRWKFENGIEDICSRSQNDNK